MKRGAHIILRVAENSQQQETFRFICRTEGGRLIVVPDERYHERWAEYARVTNVTHDALAPA